PATRSAARRTCSSGLAGVTVHVVSNPTRRKAVGYSPERITPSGGKRACNFSSPSSSRSAPETNWARSASVRNSFSAWISMRALSSVRDGGRHRQLHAVPHDGPVHEVDRHGRGGQG